MIVRCLACGKVMIADDKHPGFQICGCKNDTMVDWCDEYLYRLGGVDLSKIEVDGQIAGPKTNFKKKKKAPKEEKELSWWRINQEDYNNHIGEIIEYLNHSKELLEATIQDNERLSNKIAPVAQKDWNEYLPDDKHSKLKKIWSKTWHIVLSFIIGVVLATIFHIIVSNHQIRKTAEAVCTVFGSDEQQCKDGIDDVLNMSDNVVQNNTNVKGE